MQIKVSRVCKQWVSSWCPCIMPKIIIIFELTTVTTMITILKLHYDQPRHDRISNCEKNPSAGWTSSTNNKPLQSDDHFRKKVSFSWFLYLNQIIVSLKIYCSFGSWIMYITIRIHCKKNAAPGLFFLSSSSSLLSSCTWSLSASGPRPWTFIAPYRPERTVAAVP